MTIVDRLDPSVAAAVDQAAAALPFGPAYSDWIAAVEESRPPAFEMSFLVLPRAERPPAVAVFYRRSLDLSAYAGDGVAHAIQALRRLGVRGFRSSVGFLAVPFSNGPGLLIPGDAGEEEAAALHRRAVTALRERFPVPVLMVRSQPADPVRQALRSLGFLDRRLDLPDTVLDLPYRSFEEYVSGLDKKMRYKIRTERKSFADAGGSVELLADPEPHLRSLWDLYRNTLSRHVGRGEAVPPVEVTEDFLRSCLLGRPHRFGALVARLGSRPVGFFLIIRAGENLFVRHSGQDYALTRDSKAYFNLWYGAIRHAIEKGCTRLFMGTTTYFVKMQMGARLQPIDNHFYFRFKTLGRVVSLLRLGQPPLDLRVSRRPGAAYA